ncbi:MAG: APC family permease [Bradymonadaceae bacterium]
MSDGEGGSLGLAEVVAMGVGGMVSGGIYAILGIAMKQSGNAVPVSYAIAGALTLITAYSYVKLTLHFGEGGGVFSFIEHTIGDEHLAGYIGWVLLFGYVGVMAMYAYAFGAYSLTAARELFGVELPQLLRPIFSASIVGIFVSLNLAGVEETGFVEDVAVYFKVAVLLSFGTLGILYYDGDLASLTFFSEGYVSPIVGFAIIFVSYEGFQLLVYDYKEIEDVERNLPLGMYLAIGIATLIYLLVSFMATLQLSAAELVHHQETALAKAVSNIPLLGEVGFVLVILSALKSTSSGINATLFGTARFAHKVAAEGKLPRVFSFRNREGIPVYALLVVGGLTMLLTVFGELGQITEFGSVAFLSSYAVANFVNLRLRDRTDSNAVLPFLGLVGTAGALPVVLHHLYRTDPVVLAWILGLFVGLAVLEFAYMERQSLRESLEELDLYSDAEIEKILADRDE